MFHMNLDISHWLVFTASLSGRAASTQRVRLWRALKDLGAAALRDGVTLLPAIGTHREKLQVIGEQVEAEGGSVWLFEVPEQTVETDARLRDAFDRSDAWQALCTNFKTQRSELPRLDEASARRRLRQCERDLENIARVDFFPDDAQAQAREALEELIAMTNRRFSPAEPTAENGEVDRLVDRDYCGRTWATRKHLWVDRVVSAWLVHRFIDKTAHFIWMEKPEDCPEGALGFDFDGATFTHVGERVTFEVLLASFGLETDPGLTALGRLVHYLDVGGEPVA